MFTNGNEIENVYEKNKEFIFKQIAERNERDRTYIRCGIKGEPKTYKTSIILNSRTEKDIKEGKKICILDWDDGAEVTWRANYNADPNIIIFNPNVKNKDGSPNFKLSEEMAETFIRMVDGWCKTDEVKAFAIDGVDKWLVRCYDILTKGKKDTDFTSTIETERIDSKDGVDFIIRVESSKAYPDKIGHTHKVLSVANGKVTHNDLDFIKEGKI